MISSNLFASSINFLFSYKSCKNFVFLEPTIIKYNKSFVWKLSLLELSPCSHNPCLHKGVCFEKGSMYTCQCKKGYRGHTCQEKDPCFPNPCGLNGQCLERSGETICKCHDGWMGDVCTSRFLISSLNRFSTKRPLENKSAQIIVQNFVLLYQTDIARSSSIVYWGFT